MLSSWLPIRGKNRREGTSGVPASPSVNLPCKECLPHVTLHLLLVCTVGHVPHSEPSCLSSTHVCWSLVLSGDQWFLCLSCAGAHSPILEQESLQCFRISILEGTDALVVHVALGGPTPYQCADHKPFTYMDVYQCYCESSNNAWFDDNDHMYFWWTGLINIPKMLLSISINLTCYKITDT